MTSAKVLRPLPVPSLDATLKKYVASLEPLLTPGELSEVKELVAKALAPDSPEQQLQQHLEQRATSHRNWLEEWWLDTAYLEGRAPLVPQESILLHTSSNDARLTQTQRAAQLVCGILLFLREGMPQGPVDMAGRCTYQFTRLFSECRIPGATVDVRTPAPASSGKPASRHITVAVGNSFFELQVLDNALRPLSPSQVEAALSTIVDISRSLKQAEPLGVLTSMGRTAWADARLRLLELPGNQASLESIQSSLFLVTLESSAPQPSIPRELLLDLLAARNIGGRWHDKCVSLVVFPDARAGVNFEHSVVDGGAVTHMLDAACALFEKTSQAYKWSTERPPHPRHLPIRCPPLFRETVLQPALRVLADVRHDLDVRVLEFTSFGSDALKKLKHSPDSFFQVALQLAYFRLYLTHTATYESVSTGRFHHGRTETGRSLTMEAVRFVRAMVDGSDIPTQRHLLTMAINAHTQYNRECAAGYGVDRHLLGLRLVARQQGRPPPALLTHPSFDLGTRWRLSTSHLRCNAATAMCFAAVEPDGFGVMYSLLPSRLVATISSFRSCESTSSVRMEGALVAALRDMFALCEQARL
mmetsp:Transcript_24245/g.60734  ORF Transcript_24245/g.60734 Transcript_24245/m.60734 type:complete len:587 (-) Transcript_24245:155-1915(-)|eukprot:CAMPEP_0177681384 /NCGR_PEP_ID=MMETSP0447-20121125/30689_1 /TAXON_ID=0 /ORGANISM="Stygamoeba regulata, Strain BSH-02190019" /LENGTH=586 /DNA_ID=CAMNT_0019190801 /DNA_START=12 /DNA_END=1772 /DNA_ORIENTATION=+